MADKTPDTRKKELHEQLDKIEALSNSYYRQAANIGLHTFIEHTGFMNEHLKILRKAVDAGVDIHFLNNHNEECVHVEPYEAAYLAEKFACMFAPILKDRKAWNTFVKAAEDEGCGEHV